MRWATLQLAATVAAASREIIMPLYEGLTAAVEKTAVIFDLGTVYTKVGFAGECQPRAIIRSEVKCTKTNKVIKVFEQTEDDELYDTLIDFLHVIYFRHLLVNTRDRRVIICESFLCPSSFRETLAKVLFKHYEVPSILYAPSHLLVLFTLGINTALVIDCGYKETLVLPVCECTPILKGWQGIPLAGCAIYKRLEAHLLENGMVRGHSVEEKPLSSIMGHVQEAVLEDIKVKTCFVCNFQRSAKIKESLLDGSAVKRPPPPPAVEYPLDGGRILAIDGQIREIVCEVLFEQDNEEKSVATLILDSIIQCPIDFRKTLAHNLVCVGGTTMLPGFKDRLMSELKNLLERPKYRQKLAFRNFKMHSPPSQPNYTAWLGGAILGSLEVLSYRSLSKEHYRETGRVPDWCMLDAEAQLAELAPKDKVPPQRMNIGSLTKTLLARRRESDVKREWSPRRKESSGLSDQSETPPTKQ
ncbi:actin-related protein 10-like [Antedon mediterranea]|uniref:actin-related protein 10-like n=1 Tax=Antedon mediterranea TaxID=105859 RepID=UPI003AF9BCE3